MMLKKILPKKHPNIQIFYPFFFFLPKWFIEIYRLPKDNSQVDNDDENNYHTNARAYSNYVPLIFLPS